MQLETIFSLSGGVAMAGWLALALAPLARTRLVLIARAIALVLCAAYLVELGTITTAVAGSGFGSLAGVAALFSQPGNVMLGWTHYLAFDLMIGSFEVEDAPTSGVPHWLVLPCLFVTLMAGPVGLLLYVTVRTVARRVKHG